jgi:hypothetical protein
VSNGGLPPGFFFASVDGDSIYERKRAGYPLPPGSPSRGSDITGVAEKANSAYLSDRDLSY